jgi:hypothetical protein
VLTPYTPEFSGARECPTNKWPRSGRPLDGHLF